MTGILNGTGLRATDFWPKMDQPFCLLFAKNSIPNQNDAFHFISPYREKQLNDEGKVTVDYKDSHPITFGEIYSQPSIFKILFRGSILDLKFINKFILGDESESSRKLALADYWKNNLGLATGEGYQATGERNSTENLMALSPKHLRAAKGLLPVINTDELPNFDIEYLHRTRSPKIYKAPLLLLRHTLSAQREQTKAYLSLDDVDVVYYESFYGFSAHGHPHSEYLVMYLFALCNSDLFYYYQLMTNPKYGVEREQVYKTDMDTFPIIPYESIDKRTFRSLRALVRDANSTPNLIDKLSNWINHVYGISDTDEELIKETVMLNSPTSESLKFAEEKVSTATLNDFISYLEQETNSFLSLANEQVVIKERAGDISSWKFISISKSDKLFNAKLYDLTKDLSGGKTQIKIVQGGVIYLGMPNQNRYWSKTRARILLQELLQDLEQLN